MKLFVEVILAIISVATPSTIPPPDPVLDYFHTATCRVVRWWSDTGAVLYTDLEGWSELATVVNEAARIVSPGTLENDIITAAAGLVTTGAAGASIEVVAPGALAMIAAAYVVSGWDNTGVDISSFMHRVHRPKHGTIGNGNSNADATLGVFPEVWASERDMTSVLSVFANMTGIIHSDSSDAEKMEAVNTGLTIILGQPLGNMQQDLTNLQVFAQDMAMDYSANHDVSSDYPPSPEEIRQLGRVQTNAVALAMAVETLHLCLTSFDHTGCGTHYTFLEITRLSEFMCHQTCSFISVATNLISTIDDPASSNFNAAIAARTPHYCNDGCGEVSLLETGPSHWPFGSTVEFIGIGCAVFATTGGMLSLWWRFHRIDADHQSDVYKQWPK